MFPMTVTINTPEQLHAVTALLVGDAPSATTATIRAPRNAKADTKPEVEAVKVDTKKPDAAPSSEPTQTQSDSSKDSSEESTAASESDTEQPSYQDVAALIIKVSRTAGRDAAVELLDSFGAKRGPDLKPEQYADVVAACKKALA